MGKSAEKAGVWGVTKDWGLASDDSGEVGFEVSGVIGFEFNGLGVDGKSCNGWEMKELWVLFKFIWGFWV